MFIRQSKKQFFTSRTNAQIASNIFMIIVVLLWIIPIWFVVNNAFKKPEFIYTNPLTISFDMLTIKNIVSAFRGMKYVNAFASSAIILIIQSVILIAASSIAAYGLAFARNKTAAFLYSLMIALITLPFQMTMIPLVYLMNALHLTNNYFGTALVYVARGMPVAIFMYFSFIQSVPRELEESATVDGCGMFKTFLYIYMPLLKTITGVILILRGIFTWNDLLVPILTMSKSAMYPLPMKLYAFASSNVVNWELLFASTLLVSFPITIAFVLLQRVFVGGVIAGAVKG